MTPAAATAPTVIDARGLGRDYVLGGETVHALCGVDLRVEPNEYVAIMGPSGSGKSTLMNVIGCLDTPTAGEYRLNGALVSAQVLAHVGLADRMRHRPNELSGGQRQRVAIARALVMRPALLLADEPTGNLDTRTGDDVMALFDELHAEGQTIVLVTHEADIARRARRRVVLRDGRVESDDVVGDGVAPTGARR